MGGGANTSQLNDQSPWAGLEGHVITGVFCSVFVTGRTVAVGPGCAVGLDVLLGCLHHRSFPTRSLCLLCTSCPCVLPSLGSSTCGHVLCCALQRRSLLLQRFAAERHVG